MFSSIFTSGINSMAVVLAVGASLLLGLMIALVYRLVSRNQTPYFLVTLMLMPTLVMSVILMVNGNLGAGVAVAGAFSLTRFRSAQGTAQEICMIFLTMAVGLACGMGYLVFAGLITLLLLAVFILAVKVLFPAEGRERRLKIVVAEDMDYIHAFDPSFESFTAKHFLERTKTTNMGSLFELTYRVTLKNAEEEKAFFDDLRCRNGNLPVTLDYKTTVRDTL